MNDLLAIFSDAKNESLNFCKHPGIRLDIEGRTQYLRGLTLLAHADGSFSPNEADYIGLLLQTFNFDNSLMADLVAFAITPDKQAIKEMIESLSDEQVRFNFYFDCLVLVHKDGTVSEAEIKLLSGLSEWLRLGEHEVEVLNGLYTAILARDIGALYRFLRLPMPYKPNAFEYLLDYYKITLASIQASCEETWTWLRVQNSNGVWNYYNKETGAAAVLNNGRWLQWPDKENVYTDIMENITWCFSDNRKDSIPAISNPDTETTVIQVVAVFLKTINKVPLEGLNNWQLPSEEQAKSLTGSMPRGSHMKNNQSIYINTLTTLKEKKEDFDMFSRLARLSLSILDKRSPLNKIFISSTGASSPVASTSDNTDYWFVRAGFQKSNLT